MSWFRDEAPEAGRRRNTGCFFGKISAIGAIVINTGEFKKLKIIRGSGYRTRDLLIVSPKCYHYTTRPDIRIVFKLFILKDSVLTASRKSSSRIEIVVMGAGGKPHFCFIG